MNDPIRASRVLRVREVQRQAAHAERASIESNRTARVQLAEKLDQLHATYDVGVGETSAFALRGAAYQRGRIGRSMLDTQSLIRKLDEASESARRACMDAEREVRTAEKFHDRQAKLAEADHERRAEAGRITRKR